VQATRSSVLMLLGGEPVGERFIEWNFVSSSKGAHSSGERGLARRSNEAADLDNAEFVPLPRDPLTSAGAMS